jgi:hypothetical protein
VPAIKEIGVRAQLNETESDLESHSAEDYIVVDFLLLAELDDGRRVETAVIYQESGPRNAWGPVEGWPVEPRLSTRRVEEMARLRLGPDGQFRHAWKGVTSRLGAAGMTISIDELLRAPFGVTIDRHLEQALAG